MSILNVEAIDFTFSGNPLLKDASMRLFYDDHAVLVGPNGHGKSTFMRLIARELSPDSGKIEWLPHIQIGYLDQFLTLDPKHVVQDYIIDVFKPLFDLEAQMIDYYEQASIDGPDQMKWIHYAQDISEQLEEKEFYQIKSKVDNVVKGLGLSEHVLTQTLETLSGGMKMKVMLAKLLLQELDVLLLDEPTNFLDVTHIDFLANYLNLYDRAFLVISHDERFLQMIAKTVFAIESKKIERYKGTYEYYMIERELRYSQQVKVHKTQQQKIKKEEAFIQKNIVRASTTKRAQSRRKMLEKIVRVDKPNVKKTYTFDFPFSYRTGDIVLTTENLQIGYEGPLLEPLNIEIRRGDKVAITGKNGIGKTTLIKTLLKDIDYIDGMFHWIDTVDIAYFSQLQSFSDDITAYSHMRAYYEGVEDKFIYTQLGSYGITYEMAHRPLKSLSGGEQTKVRLSVLKKQKSNVLILDEPTNHLDESAKEALKDAMIAYQGTMILVSHEPDIYEGVCDTVIELFV